MKKYLFLAVTAIVALASCSDNSLVGEGVVVPVENELTPITFSSTSAATTRGNEATGADAATKLNNNFVVEGVKWNGNDTKEVVYDHYNVKWLGNAYSTTSNTSGWEYVGQTKHAYGPAGNQVIKFWDYAKSQYDFIAYSVGTADADYSTNDYVNTKVKISEIDATKMNGTNNEGEVQTDVANITKGAYTIKGKAENLAKVYIADLVTAYRDASGDDPSDYQNTVQFKFRTLSAKVRIGLYETVPGYSVKDVVFYSDANTRETKEYNTWGDVYLFTSGSSNVFNSEGTYTVYFPTTGAAKAPGRGSNDPDYNKAHLKFTAETSGTANNMNFGELVGTLSLDNLASAENAEEAGYKYLGRSSASATFSGSKTNHYYKVVLPNETGAVLNLKVDYTLLATDGSGEVIRVKGATATVPAQYAQWKSGYAYTYIFKISENTNGVTNTEAGPAGLYPITFDAVVMNDELAGTQETITTVSEPSITTFGYDATNKKYISSTNDYAAGNDVYAVVMEGSNVVNVKVGSTTGNVHIYRDIVSSDPDNFPVTEASFAEALEKTSVGTKKITFKHVCAGVDAAENTWFYAHVKNVTEVPGEDGNTKAIRAVQLKNLPAGTYAVRYVKTAPTVTPAVYTAVTAVLTSGDTYYIKNTSSDTGYSEYVATGSEDTSTTTYYTLTSSSEYTAVTAVLTSGTTYYIEDASSDTGYIEYVATGSEDTSTTTYYTLTTPASESSPGQYVYKIIIVH